MSLLEFCVENDFFYPKFEYNKPNIDKYCHQTF